MKPAPRPHRQLVAVLPSDHPGHPPVAFDDQSLHGKVVSALVAGARGTPVLVLAGQVTLGESALAGAGITAAHSITDFAGSVQIAIDDAARQLTGLAEQTSARWEAGKGRE